MPKRKDLRVIPGGKSGGSETPCQPQALDNTQELLSRARRYRDLLAASPAPETSHLISDMVDAIRALILLEKSDAVNAPRQAIEYRRLIAELEIEIVSAFEPR